MVCLDVSLYRGVDAIPGGPKAHLAPMLVMTMRSHTGLGRPGRRRCLARWSTSCRYSRRALALSKT